MRTLIVNQYLSKLWTPAEMTTALWLDAADSSSITTVDGKVSQWNDLSGNNRHALQPNSSKRPVFNSIGYNNKPTLDFSLGNFMVAPRFFIPSKLNVFVVYNANGPAQRILDQRGTGPLGGIKGWQLKTYNATGDVTAFDQGDGNYYSLWNRGSSSSFLVNVGFEGSGLIYRINGEDFSSGLESSGIVTDVNSTFDIYIGANSNGQNTQLFDGILSEVILSPTSVSLSVVEKAEGYLAHKWGLTANLPVTHPYKNTLPYV